MKINSNLIALSLANASILGASAFQTPKVNPQPSTELFAAPFFATPSRDTYTEYQQTGGSQYKQTGGPQNANASLMTSGSKNVGRPNDSVLVQGGSLRTWTFTSTQVERVNVFLRTDGRPMNADVDLWQGPDNTPQKMAVYIEDGSLRPFEVTIESPRGDNTVAVRNTASLEYPLSAVVEAGTRGSGSVKDKINDKNGSKIIQGGALKTYSFAAAVGSIQVLLETDGRPLNSRIELIQGPNNNKQVIDIYCEDGYQRPFYAIIKTPGTGNVVRIVNTAPMEYPLMCAVEPYEVEPGYDPSGMTGGLSFPYL